MGSDSTSLQLLTGTSQPILSLRDMIRKVGSSRVSVLLQGESGTGKELAARAIYAARPEGEFVPIDCGSLAPTLIEGSATGTNTMEQDGSVPPESRKKSEIVIGFKDPEREWITLYGDEADQAWKNFRKVAGSQKDRMWEGDIRTKEIIRMGGRVDPSRNGSAGN